MRLFRVFILLSLAFAGSGCAFFYAAKFHAIENLQKQAETARQHVEEKLKNSPESVTQDSLAVLDSILNYADTVKADPGKFDDGKIQEYLQKINIINDNIERFHDLTLETDVSFPLGTYKLEHLSAAGRRSNDELVDKIIAGLQDLKGKYPGSTLRITLKTVGYTDETEFSPGTDLEKAIRAELGGAAPENPRQRRQVYNEILSSFRAASLNNYLAEALRAKLKGYKEYTVEIKQKIIGRGESIPGQGKRYRAQDPRRRICVISPFIEILP